MIFDTSNPDFSTLLTRDIAIALLKRLNTLISQNRDDFHRSSLDFNSYNNLKKLKLDNLIVADSEAQATDELIKLFDTLFFKQQVTLVRGSNEPEYFPAQGYQPARIEFAHGFFTSALHEISHWCIAGESRRQLIDYGYWYAPDGRSATKQLAFERVEIKPQAIECLFNLACQRPFKVSQDNLFANFDTSNSTFAYDVYQQVKEYIAKPDTLPCDARALLRALISICVVD